MEETATGGRVEVGRPVKPCPPGVPVGGDGQEGPAHLARQGVYRGLGRLAAGDDAEVLGVEPVAERFELRVAAVEEVAHHLDAPVLFASQAPIALAEMSRRDPPGAAVGVVEQVTRAAPDERAALRVRQLERLDLRVEGIPARGHPGPVDLDRALEGHAEVDRHASRAAHLGRALGREDEPGAQAGDPAADVDARAVPLLAARLGPVPCTHGRNLEQALPELVDELLDALLHAVGDGAHELVEARGIDRLRRVRASMLDFRQRDASWLPAFAIDSAAGHGHPPRVAGGQRLRNPVPAGSTWCPRRS